MHTRPYTARARTQDEILIGSRGVHDTVPRNTYWIGAPTPTLLRYAFARRECFVYIYGTSNNRSWKMQLAWNLIIRRGTAGEARVCNRNWRQGSLDWYLWTRLLASNGFVFQSRRRECLIFLISLWLFVVLRAITAIIVFLGNMIDGLNPDCGDSINHWKLTYR